MPCSFTFECSRAEGQTNAKTPESIISYVSLGRYLSYLSLLLCVVRMIVMLSGLLKD